ncbi:hypothetical protein BZA05DRAFT_336729 [Tricharina praecox]|uniref:uncharacterized protein n=1 Tax=Tricharina praecox TaxID=43433 RepID=UPI00221E7222|nr:uncharacterized protein BZA05DRAFT_336729 [Tricharina praecox]KAI5853398.1 hypothetical protein BZA05DRAFT_336729 [Tricharina praecox]
MTTYVRMGRGGAGNHIPKEELQKQAPSPHLAEEVTAQTSASKRLSSANQLAQEEVASPPPGEYKHMGRGGAGNWFTPSDLVQRGTTSTPTADDDTTEVPAAQAGSTRQWAGRGGAGNFAGAGAQAQHIDAPRKEVEEIELQDRERERMQEDVRRDVDLKLVRPEGVHLGP